MKRAVYSDQTRGHFGLAKKFYTHFTSPIRRYPDLVAHRVLASTLDLTPSPYERDELAALGTHCSWTEQTADEAERFLVEIKKYRFLEQQLRERRPQVYDAVVVNVRNFGMFVELIDLQVQGLVHISAISDRIVRYDAARDILRDGAVAYGVGAKVKVYVVKVDFDQRRLDFALVRDSRRGKA
jgi:ribonuclease R